MIIARTILALSYLALCFAVWIGAKSLAPRGDEPADATRAPAQDRNAAPTQPITLSPASILDLRQSRDLPTTLAEIKSSLAGGDAASVALLIEQLDASELADVFAFAEGLPPENRKLLQHYTLMRLAKLDGSAAMHRASEIFPVGVFRDRLPGIVAAWAKGDPAAAFDWTREQQAMFEGKSTRADSGLVLTDLVGMRERQPNFGEMFALIITSWGAEDLDAAIDHALQLREAHRRESLNRLTVLFGVFEQHREELLARASDLPRTDEVLQYAAMGWADWDLPGYATWLSSADLSPHERNIFEVELISRNRWSHPDFVARWLIEHRSGEPLEKELTPLVNEWASFDHQNASKWIVDNVHDAELRHRLEKALADR